MRRNAAEFGDGKIELQTECTHIRDISELARKIGDHLVEQEARRKRAPQEVRFSETEIIILLECADRHVGTYELSAAEQVAFGVTEIEQQTLLR